MSVAPTELPDRFEPPAAAVYDLVVPEAEAGELQEAELDVARRIRLGRRRTWRERLLSWPWKPWKAWTPGSVELQAAILERREVGGGRLALRIVILEPPRRLA